MKEGSLSFSPNLDDYNPDIPEWRRDVSRVIKKALVEVSVASSFWPRPFPCLPLSFTEGDPCTKKWQGRARGQGKRVSSV